MDPVVKILLFITAKSGRRPASILCNEDPWIMLDGQFMHNVFPNGKFLLLIRDGQHVLSMVRISMSFHQGIEWWIYCRILNICFDFFSADIKIRSESSPIDSKLSLLSWGTLIIPWRCPIFQHSVIKKLNSKKYSRFNTKFIIQCPVEITWSEN